MNAVNQFNHCPGCGTEIKSNHKFCPFCGEDLNIQEYQPMNFEPPTQMLPEVQSYPDQIVDEYDSEYYSEPSYNNPSYSHPNINRAYSGPNTNNVYTNHNNGYSTNYPNNPYNNAVNYNNTYNQYSQSNYANPAIDVYNARPKKSYKNLIIWIATSFAILVAVIATIFVIKYFSDKKAAEELKKNQQLAYEEYMDDAYDFYAGIAADAIKLVEIGNDVEKYWYDAIWENEYGGNVDLAVDNAFLINSSDMNTIKSNYSTYELMFDELCEIPEGEKKSELENSREEITNLWKAYEELYHVVTEPAGSIVTFADNLKEADSELSDVISECEYIIYGN